MFVELEVETGSGKIVRVSTTWSPPFAQAVLSEVLEGRLMTDGPKGTVKGVRERYIGPTTRAICAAVTAAYDAYGRFAKGLGADAGDRLHASALSLPAATA